MHSSTAEGSDLYGPHISSDLSGRRGGGEGSRKRTRHIVIITIDNHLVDNWLDG